MARSSLLRRRNFSANSRAQAQFSKERRGSLYGPRAQSGPYTKEAQAAQEFAELVSDVSVGELAQAGGVSKETAKNWKKGRRLPNSATLLWDLAPNIEIIGDWAVGIIKSGARPHDGVEEQQAHALADFVASVPGPQGEALRGALKKVLK